jgi:hypothetical protein
VLTFIISGESLPACRVTSLRSWSTNTPFATPAFTLRSRCCKSFARKPQLARLDSDSPRPQYSDSSGESSILRIPSISNHHTNTKNHKLNEQIILAIIIIMIILNTIIIEMLLITRYTSSNNHGNKNGQNNNSNNNTNTINNTKI